MNKRLIKVVGETIRHFRKRLDISQEELAARAKLDRTYISGVERSVRNITLDSLEQIIDALDVAPGTFIAHVAKELRDGD